MHKKSNIYPKNKTTENIILELFFKKPSERFNIREVARKLKIAPSTVSIATRGLINKRFLLREQLGKSIYLSANLENMEFIFEKMMYNIKKIKYSNLIDFLVKNYKPEAIVIYGSYSRGEDIENSDIDIAVITPLKKHLDLRNFTEFLARSVHILEINNLNKISKELTINIINGFVIYGKLRL